MNLPPEFSPEDYRTYVDLAHMADEELSAHYRDYGVREGRWCSTIRSRGDFVALVDSNDKSIEVGPFYNPQIVGPNVSYFEVLDRRALIERANALNVDSSRTPEIDFVSPVGDLSVVDRTFDCCLSSHCIEHQPNLVKHLRDAGALLRDEGRYFIIAPDKRYCFDHFLPDATLAEIVQAHHESRSVHTFKSVFEHRLLTCHNDPENHWRGVHGPAPTPTAEGLRRVEEEWRAAEGGYIDVHAWQFTPESFRNIINALFDLGLQPFKVERVYQTIHGSTEFYAVLSKP